MACKIVSLVDILVFKKKDPQSPFQSLHTLVLISEKRPDDPKPVITQAFARMADPSRFFAKGGFGAVRLLMPVKLFSNWEVAVRKYRPHEVVRIEKKMEVKANSAIFKLAPDLKSQWEMECERAKEFVTNGLSKDSDSSRASWPEWFWNLYREYPDHDGATVREDLLYFYENHTFDIHASNDCRFLAKLRELGENFSKTRDTIFEKALVLFENEFSIQRQCTHPGNLRVLSNVYSATGIHHTLIKNVRHKTDRDRKLYVQLEFWADRELALMFRTSNLFAALSYFQLLEKKSALLVNKPQLPSEKIWPLRIVMARQLAETLAANHALNIVHRDVKPENVLVNNLFARLGNPKPNLPRTKLCDFGAARFADDPLCAHTDGTVLYMPPELIRRDELSKQELEQVRYDAKAGECWSFGLTFYALLFGNVFVWADDSAGRRKRILECTDAEITQTVAEKVDAIPGEYGISDVARAEIKHILTGILRINASERMSMAEVADQLRKLEQLLST